jgi:phosphoribosylformylglycinamidine (FGAM) synthase-like enzyme
MDQRLHRSLRRGLALAAFEMAEAGDVGVTLDAADTPTLFGEDQGRYLIACNFDRPRR